MQKMHGRQCNIARGWPKWLWIRKTTDLVRAATFCSANLKLPFRSAYPLSTPYACILSPFYLIRTMIRNKWKTDFQCSLFRWFPYRWFFLNSYYTSSSNFPLAAIFFFLASSSSSSSSSSSFSSCCSPLLQQFFFVSLLFRWSLSLFSFVAVLNLFSLNFFTIIYYCKGCKIKSAPNMNDRKNSYTKYTNEPEK